MYHITSTYFVHCASYVELTSEYIDNKDALQILVCTKLLVT